MGTINVTSKRTGNTYPIAISGNQPNQQEDVAIQKYIDTQDGIGQVALPEVDNSQGGLIDFVKSKIIDQSALKAIEDIADKYNSLGKKVKLRHLTRDCHKLLSKAGQLVVDSDDDPDYGVAVDYDVKLGIFGK
jgi:SulP family sulfate permease